MSFKSRLSMIIVQATRRLSSKGECVTPEKLHHCDLPCGSLKGLVVGAYETCDGIELTPSGKLFDDEEGGCISAAIKEAKLKLGDTYLVTNVKKGFHSIAVAGLGDKKAGNDGKQNIDETKENVRIASAAGVLALEKIGVRAIEIEDFGDEQAAAEGASLGIWKYQEIKDMKKRKKTMCIALCGNNNSRIDPHDKNNSKGWNKGLSYACAQNTARTLEEVPPNVMTPLNFGQYAIDLLCELGIHVEIRDLKWIEDNNLSAFLKVAQGSCEYPCLVELSYCGGNSGESPYIGFVGQGTTFNSGGVCLKSCDEMRYMGADMAGGAVIVGLFQGAAKTGVPQNMKAFIPLYENMPGGMALKPGDVICSSGKTVRLQNTAKEARVVLGDVLSYIRNIKDPPIKKLFNVGSVSHKGMTHSLGNSATGLFTNSQDISDDLKKAGADTGDRIWPLPLWDTFRKRLTDISCCDIQNESPTKGGDPSMAASFLNTFLPETVEEFAHLDISGTGLLSGGYGKPYLKPESMSGRPTRTLLEYVSRLPSQT